MDKAIIHLYSQQSGSGYDIPFYSGYPRYQVGGKFLGGLLRFALPLFKKLGASALQVAAGAAQDVVNKDKPIKESLFKHMNKEVKRKFKNIESDDSNDTIYKQSFRPKRRRVISGHR